jgi:DNA-directed RNA polymerase specialized sigma subunit
MSEFYKTIQCYRKISLSEERCLIARAQNGSKKSRNEIVLHHIEFLRFRIRKIVFPHLLRRFEDDLLGEAVLILYAKIESYDLDYCDKHGEPHPVKFTSYIWKRIDGFIIDFLKEETRKIKLDNEMSGQNEVDITNAQSFKELWKLESEMTGQNGQICEE